MEGEREKRILKVTWRAIELTGMRRGFLVFSFYIYVKIKKIDFFFFVGREK